MNYQAKFKTKSIMKILIISALLICFGLSFYTGSVVLPNYSNGIGRYIAPKPNLENIKDNKSQTVNHPPMEKEIFHAEFNLTQELAEIENFELKEAFNSTGKNIDELNKILSSLELKRQNLLQDFSARINHLVLVQNRDLQRQRDELVRADARGFERGRQELLSKFKK